MSTSAGRDSSSLAEGAILVYRFDRRLATEMDETEQSGSGAADGEARYRDAREAVAAEDRRARADRGLCRNCGWSA